MRPKDVSESDFTGICLRKLRKFARKNNLCIIIVAHPTKIYRIKDSKEYPIPTLYDISGSANWYNKTDNGMVVYRVFERDVIQIHVKKVKFKNYGELGMVEWKWNKETGLFTEITGFEAQKRTDF
jgi:twinkle protein